jgi:hypothetical protein
MGIGPSVAGLGLPWCGKHLGGPTVFNYHDNMRTSIRDNAKTPKRRPPQTGELIGVRIQPQPLALIDAWRRKQSDLPSRAEAIRRLVEYALGAPRTTLPKGTRKAQKASELADRAAESIVDKSMPPEEQQHRKRALIKGPKEFRDIREDSPNGKIKS